MNPPAHSTLFVGVGSPHGDDQIGWRIADVIADDPPANVAVRKASTPTCLLDWLDGVERLAVCDACRGAGPPGSLLRFEWDRETANPGKTVLPALSRMRTAGTHSFGTDAVLDLALRLDRLPPQIVVWGVEGRNFEPGRGVSALLEERLPGVAAEIRSELAHWKEANHA